MAAMGRGLLDSVERICCSSLMRKLGVTAVCFSLATHPVQAEQAFLQPMAYSFKAAAPAATAPVADLPDPLRQASNAPLRLGPVSVSGDPVEARNRSGLQLRASMPLTARLDLVLDAYGGHDSTMAGNAIAAAAVTMGLRLKF